MTLEGRLAMLEAAVANIIGLLRAGEFRETPIDDPNDLEPRFKEEYTDGSHTGVKQQRHYCAHPSCDYSTQFESDLRNHKAGHNMPDRSSEWDEFLNAMAREEYPRYAAQRILEERKK